MTLEGRTSLLGLRRAASRLECHGTVVLGIGDNLTEVMALEKGRSGSWCLNVLCRHSCAWQTATGIRWRRRHIGTLRNYADEASRFATKGLVHPSQPLVLKGAARRQSHMAAASGARVAARVLRADRAQRPPFAPGGPPAASARAEPNPPWPRFVLIVGADAEPLAGALHDRGLLTGPLDRELRAVGLDPARAHFASALRKWLAERSLWSIVWALSGEQRQAGGASSLLPGPPLVLVNLDDPAADFVPHLTSLGPSDSTAWRLPAV